MVNIRQKGQGAEREIAKVLNSIIVECLREADLPIPAKDIVQRNQNQSAVGGNDLSNCFGLSIEVKRQEQLAINTWWNQTLEAAQQNDETPVLVFKQSRKAWRVILMVWLPVPASGGSWSAKSARAEIDWATFQEWFREWVKRKLEQGERPRV